MPALLVGVGAWALDALAGSSIAALLRVAGSYIIRLLGIKVLLATLWAAFWATLVYFGKQVLVWFVDLAFYMLAQAMDALNFPDIMTSLVTSVQDGLPEAALGWLIMLGVFDTIRFWISCYFANRAMRIVPVVGKAFGG